MTSTLPITASPTTASPTTASPTTASATSPSPTSPGRRHPVRLTGEPDEHLSRWLWLVKMVLVVPHLVVLAFLGVGFVLATFAAGVAVLATGRYPRSLFAFDVGVLRWSWRVGFYSFAALGTDRYPPFTLRATDYPAGLEVDHPEHVLRRRVLLSGVLALPHLLVVALLTTDLLPYPWSAGPGVPSSGFSVTNLVVVLAGFFLLVTGRYPRSLFDLLLGIDRWCYRVLTYVAFMHDEYPPFRLDAGPVEPGVAAAAPAA